MADLGPLRFDLGVCWALLPSDLQLVTVPGRGSGHGSLKGAAAKSSGVFC